MSTAAARVELCARALLASTVAALFVSCFVFSPALAEDEASASLKPMPMSPQIDPSADINHKVQKPLQATIEHTEKVGARKKPPLKSGVAQQGGFMGKLRGGARSATLDTLKANAANQSPLAVQATSGYGIIGVKFVLALGKPPVINRVFAGTPAAKVGLQPNDTIVAVDGVPTYGLSKEEVYDLIIGSPGTSVNVSIMRGADFRVVNCTRMDINDITDPLVRRDYLMNM
jgi:membrane-associated protease RseP (regulator of RpoE activity)